MDSERSLLPGTLDVLILRTLSVQRMHGYGVSRFIRERSDGFLRIESAALYPALHRLERKGWVRSEWGISETNRRAKFYELTEKGHRHLHREDRELRAYMAALNLVLDAV